MVGSIPSAGKKKSAMTNTGPRLLYDSERQLQTPLCFLQIPQGLLHLHDWTLMVLDSVQLCRLFLHILAWLRCGLVNFFFLWAFVLCISSFQYRYIVVLTHGDLRKDLADDHVVCIRNDLFTEKKKNEKISSGVCWQYKTRWCLHVLLPVQSGDPAHDRVNCSLNFFLTFLPF